jgi:hypothetical protein
MGYDEVEQIFGLLHFAHAGFTGKVLEKNKLFRATHAAHIQNKRPARPPPKRRRDPAKRGQQAKLAAGREFCICAAC